jgi:hypothetical protein
MIIPIIMSQTWKFTKLIMLRRLLNQRIRNKKNSNKAHHLSAMPSTGAGMFALLLLLLLPLL